MKQGKLISRLPFALSVINNETELINNCGQVKYERTSLEIFHTQ